MSDARALRGRSLASTLAGRDVALWSDFTGADPEGGGDVPSGRSWMVRLDLDLQGA